jgi:hypothetical protein
MLFLSGAEEKYRELSEVAVNNNDGILWSCVLDVV